MAGLALHCDQYRSSFYVDELLRGRVDAPLLIDTTPTRIQVGVGDLGNGVFARRLIRAGEVVLVFLGPLIAFDEAVAKGERECWPLQTGRNEYVDLESPGCYANHSCDPNSGVVLDHFLVAIRDIPAGTEVRYDYSTTVDEDSWSMECKCKSMNCRGRISDFKYLHPAIRQRYLELGIVQRFIARQYASDLGPLKGV